MDPGSGAALSTARLTREGDALHVTTGPAVAYWNPANTASGDYTVKASFREPQYMNRNDHPHPYGVFIGGNDMPRLRQGWNAMLMSGRSPGRTYSRREDAEEEG